MQVFLRYALVQGGRWLGTRGWVWRVAVGLAAGGPAPAGCAVEAKGSRVQQRTIVYIKPCLVAKMWL